MYKAQAQVIRNLVEGQANQRAVIFSFAVSRVNIETVALRKRKRPWLASRIKDCYKGPS